MKAEEPSCVFLLFSCFLSIICFSNFPSCFLSSVLFSFLHPYFLYSLLSFLSPAFLSFLLLSPPLSIPSFLHFTSLLLLFLLLFFFLRSSQLWPHVPVVEWRVSGRFLLLSFCFLTWISVVVLLWYVSPAIPRLPSCSSLIQGLSWEPREWTPNMCLLLWLVGVCVTAGLFQWELWRASAISSSIC